MWTSKSTNLGCYIDATLIRVGDAPKSVQHGTVHLQNDPNPYPYTNRVSAFFVDNCVAGHGLWLSPRMPSLSYNFARRVIRSDKDQDHFTNELCP